MEKWVLPKHMASIDGYKSAKAMFDCLGTIYKVVKGLSEGKDALVPLHQALLTASGALNTFQARPLL